MARLKRQNSTVKVYLWVFVNYKQNNRARLLPVAKLTYNNTKNASTSYTPFKLNCDFYSCAFYREDVDSHSKKIFFYYYLY